VAEEGDGGNSSHGVKAAEPALSRRAAQSRAWPIADVKKTFDAAANAP
jgi:hypothetical protein